MSNLFIDQAALQTKILTGPQRHQYNKKRRVPTESIGEEQKKGLHQLRRRIFTENIDEARKEDYKVFFMSR